MTTQIKEKCTGRVVNVEGDVVNAMQGCVNRNTMLRNAGMGGEWSVPVLGWISPEEYPRVIKKMRG